MTPIRFQTPEGGFAYGYPATVLADICEAVLAARADGELHHNQQHIASQCEILLRGFARVGIIALVDEATGYQKVRAGTNMTRFVQLSKMVVNVDAIRLILPGLVRPKTEGGAPSVGCTVYFINSSEPYAFYDEDAEKVLAAARERMGDQTEIHR
jgi:hypothetical protein